MKKLDKPTREQVKRDKPGAKPRGVSIVGPAPEPFREWGGRKTLRPRVED